MDSKLYLPIQFFTKVLTGMDNLDDPASLIFCLAMGRLRPGVSMDHANAEIAVYQKQLLDLIPPHLRRLPFFQKAMFHVDSARTGCGAGHCGHSAVTELGSVAQRAYRLRREARYHPNGAIQSTAAKGRCQTRLYQRMVDRIEQMPGIESAAVTWQTPMTGRQATAAFQALIGLNPPEDSHMAYNNVGPEYFRTMKTRLLAGREFEKSERETNVCIVNESAAKFLLPHHQPIGSYVRSTDEKQFPEGLTCRVVGVCRRCEICQPP